MRRLKWSLLVLLVLVSLWVIVGHRKGPPGETYLIPSGYVGWFVVLYNVPGAPPLPIENNDYVIRVPPNGRLTTSTKLPEVVPYYDSYYVSGNKRQHLETGFGWKWGRENDVGKNGMVWGEVYGWSGNLPAGVKFEQYFIGTQSQFDHLGSKATDEDRLNGKGRIR